MLYTKLEQNRRQQMVVGEFGGIQNRPDVPEGWWRDEQNLSSADFPRATVRKARTLCEQIDGIPARNILAMTGKDRLVWLDSEGSVWCNGHSVELYPTHWQVLPLTDRMYVGDQEKALEYFGQTARTVRLVWDEYGGTTHARWVMVEDGQKIEVDLEQAGLVPFSQLWNPQDGDVVLFRVQRAPNGMDYSLHRQFVSMGAYVVLFPDRMYVNAVKLADGEQMVYGEDYGNIENSFRLEAGTPAPTLKLTLCDAEGNAYTGAVSSDTELEDQEEGALWIDTADGGSILKRWRGTQWVEIPQTYVRLEAQGIGEGFADLDAVTLDSYVQDCPMEDADGNEITDTAARDSVIRILRTSNTIQKRSPNAITVIGLMNVTECTITLSENQSVPDQIFVAVTREAPDLDFVVECDNRLWGCHYGKGQSGQILNEIYASRLGDFRNWRDYGGLADSSYAVSRGSDGPYTGAAVLDGHPLFFKES